MYLRRTTRRRTDGSEVGYLQLAHNEWDVGAGHSVVRVLHSFGREDRLDRGAIVRLIGSLQRVLEPDQALAAAAGGELRFVESVPIGGEEFTEFATKLKITDVTFLPISALEGDNVVAPSANMPWFAGTSLLHHLEHVHIASDRNLIDARFPVQWVIRQDGRSQERGYAGQMASGALRPGDDVVVLPSGTATRIAAIETFDGPLDEAVAHNGDRPRATYHQQQRRGYGRPTASGLARTQGPPRLTPVYACANLPCNAGLLADHERRGI
jgi:hypothetical protein